MRKKSANALPEASLVAILANKDAGTLDALKADMVARHDPNAPMVVLNRAERRFKEQMLRKAKKG